jgi:hypothetical protein
MKSLSESLFDKDLTSKKLSIEKYMDDFNSYALEKLDSRTRNSLFDQLFESGTVCNAAELRNKPIDLTKNIVIQRRDGLKGLTEINYPYKYNFIYALLFEEEPRTFIATLMDYLGGKSYCWENSGFPEVDKKSTWKGKVAAFYTPSSSYSIISNEKWVKEIIDGILLD